MYSPSISFPVFLLKIFLVFKKLLPVMDEEDHLVSQGETDSSSRSQTTLLLRLLNAVWNPK